jgi:hypothetical protein
MGIGDPNNLLPELDRDFLNSKEYDFDVLRVGGEIHLIIHNFQFPAAYTPRQADLLIIIPAGYPNANLDMFWTYPDVMRANGGWPQASEHHQPHGERTWQRWSRHVQNGWRPGTDCLQTFVAAVRKEIGKGI